MIESHEICMTCENYAFLFAGRIRDIRGWKCRKSNLTIGPGDLCPDYKRNPACAKCDSKHPCSDADRLGFNCYEEWER